MPTAHTSVPTTPVPTGIYNICQIVQITSNLQAECINRTVSPLPGQAAPTPRIISPLFNITQADSNVTSFVFTLPIDPQLYVELGKISRPCEGQELSCEWQDPDTFEFRRSGCAVSTAKVNMGSGVVGTECTCTHLTVFAIVLREDLQLAPLCQAQEVDYVLIALYATLAAGLVVQLARVVKYKVFQASQASVVQHSMLCLVCVLRIVYLVAKPVITSLAGLVLLGLLPSAITLSLFIHLLLTWTSLQLATFELSPFDRFRVPFIVMTLLVFVVVAGIVVLAEVTSEVATVQIGSSVLAALYAVMCVLVLLSGLGMRRSISVVDAARGTDWRVVFRFRLLVATLGLSACLLLVACLWVAAVQSDIVTSSAATLATTASFYVCDWLSLCMLTWLFSFAVTEAKARRREGLRRVTADSSNSKKDFRKDSSSSSKRDNRKDSSSNSSSKRDNRKDSSSSSRKDNTVELDH